MLDALYKLNSYSLHPSPPFQNKDEWLSVVRERQGMVCHALFEDEAPVSIAVSTPMTHNMRGKLYPAAGIWGVSTLPAARRKGYCRQVMASLLSAECGVREGSLLYITKIPYNTKQYLAESDPTLKRFYACHCPWARQAIKNGNIHLNAVFCNCSGGFSKKPWEVIFGQTLKVDLLESALKGDSRCRFAVHLPEKMEMT